MSRMAVLMLAESHAPAWLSAQDIFRTLLQGGHSIGLGTVYRVLQELLAAELLVQKWGLHRKAFYRSPRDDSQAPMLRLVCPQRQHCVELRDDALLAQLVAAAMQQGVDLSDRTLSIRAELPQPPPPLDARERRELPAPSRPAVLAQARRAPSPRRPGAQRASSSSPPGQSRM